MKAGVPLLLLLAYLSLGAWCAWQSVVDSNPHGLKAAGGAYDVRWDPFQQRTILIQKDKGLILEENALRNPLMIRSEIPGSTIIVRVEGTDPTNLGELLMPVESESQIAVINPNGVIVGPDADLSRVFPENSSTLDRKGTSIQNKQALLIQDNGMIRAVDYPATLIPAGEAVK